MFVKLFGIVIVVVGIIFLMNPKTLKQYMSFWKQEKRLRIGGIVAILFGAIFLIAASQCRLAWLITILGIWAIIKGVLLLTLSQKKIYAFLDWWVERPISGIRFLGLIALAFGALVFYSA
ncbi:MAG: hypothetical protein WBD24_06790 [Candidatus Omnitrophota bacterium]